MKRHFSPRVFAKPDSDDGELRSALFTSKPQTSARAGPNDRAAIATTNFQSKASTRVAALDNRKNSTASSKILAKHGVQPDAKQPFQFDTEKAPEQNLAGFTTGKAKQQQLAEEDLPESLERPKQTVRKLELQNDTMISSQQGSLTRLMKNKHASNFDGHSQLSSRTTRTNRQRVRAMTASNTLVTKSQRGLRNARADSYGETQPVAPFIEDTVSKGSTSKKLRPMTAQLAQDITIPSEPIRQPAALNAVTPSINSTASNLRPHLNG